MPARFKVLTVSQITGRGRVVAGEILDGSVRPGMRAINGAVGQNQGWLISGVEFVDSIASRESHIALVLSDAPALEDLRAQLPSGSVLEIADSTST